jgi:uncharacterized SAM-binding protein YcdF (DUF218 family)
MFFLASKTLDLAVDPVWWALVAWALALLLFTRRPKLARGLGLAGVLSLTVTSLPLVGSGLMAALEADAPDTFSPKEPYDVVVLLGGAFDFHGATPERRAWNDNVERVIAVEQVLRLGQAKVAVLSGGSNGGKRSEADLLAEQLKDWGVAPERLLLEGESKNTRENALFTKKLLEGRGAQRVLLVTSAHHLRRAKECFNAVGLKVDTLPVDFRQQHADPHLLPRAESLEDTARALREFLGRAVYRSIGYSKPDGA